MKITEKLLLDNYIGHSQLGDNLSDINGKRYSWYYSAGDGEDYRIVSSREAVAAAFEQLRDKFPDDDYGYSAILREHLRPATPEEIEHRGVLKKEGNKC